MAKAPRKDLKELEAKLLAEREEYLRQLGELERSSLGVSQSEGAGEVSFDGEYADAGTATFERERDFSLAYNIKDLIDKVDHALGRVRDGTYGVCEVCGKKIDAARLKALPHATFCVECKRREEGHYR